MFICLLSQNYTHTGDLESVWPPRDMQGVNMHLEINCPRVFQNHCASLEITGKIQRGEKKPLKYLCEPDTGRWRASFTPSAAPHEAGLGTIPVLTIPAGLDCQGKGTAGSGIHCPGTPSPSLGKLGEVVTLSPGLLLFAALLWDTALHIHLLGRCGVTLLDWAGASSPDRYHPQDGCQQDGIQRWIFSSRLPTQQMWLKGFLSRAVLRVSLSSSDLGNLLQGSEYFHILFGWGTTECHWIQPQLSPWRGWTAATPLASPGRRHRGLPNTK